MPEGTLCVPPQSITAHGPKGPPAFESVVVAKKGHRTHPTGARSDSPKAARPSLTTLATLDEVIQSFPEWCDEDPAKAVSPATLAVCEQPPTCSGSLSPRRGKRTFRADSWTKSLREASVGTANVMRLRASLHSRLFFVNTTFAEDGAKQK